MKYQIFQMLEDDGTLEYIDGVASHWYRDNEMDPRIRRFLSSDKKQIFRISTESCNYIIYIFTTLN